MGGTKCRHCYAPLDPRARVCSSCGRNRNAFLNALRSAEPLGIIASMVLVVLTFMQFSEARNERIQAARALSEATAAQARAEEAAQLADSARADALAVGERMRQQELSTAKLVYLMAATKNEIGTERALAAQQAILAELDILIARAIPLDAVRAQWIQTLVGSLPAPKRDATP